MYNFNLVDYTRGFDVIRLNGKVVKHFDNYEQAWAYAEPRHLTVRYWAVKEEKEE